MGFLVPGLEVRCFRVWGFAVRCFEFGVFNVRGFAVPGLGFGVQCYRLGVGSFGVRGFNVPGFGFEFSVSGTRIWVRGFVDQGFKSGF